MVEAVVSITDVYKYKWSQGVDEVRIQVLNLPLGTTSRQLDIKISARQLSVGLKSPQPPLTLLSGRLFEAIKPDDSIWTLEEAGNDDGERTTKYKVVNIILTKVKLHCVWESVFEGGVAPSENLKDAMKRHMMLEKLQREQPGFDFSQAQLTGDVPTDPANFMIAPPHPRDGSSN
jgi:hypothetical protein